VFGKERNNGTIAQHVLIFVLAALLASACSPKMPALRSETEANMIAVLRSGQANLTCGEACAEMWNKNLSTLQYRYVGQDWLHLATLVMQIGYKTDLAYYYLGQSADALGAANAAVRYYRRANDLATRPDSQFRCNFGSQNRCNGLSFPRDLSLPMQMAQKHGASLRTTRTSAQAEKPTTFSAATGREGTGADAVDATSAPPRDAVRAASVPEQNEDWIEPPPVNR
jgi:hypothetical protein